MVELKKSTTSKKVAEAKPKTKAVSAVSEKKKAVSASATAKPKVAVKKAPAAVEEKKQKPVVKKEMVAPAMEEKAAPKKAVASKSKGGNGASRLSPEERYRMVAQAAYYIAERHGFQGHSDMHWAAAEREISEKLGE